VGTTALLLGIYQELISDLLGLRWLRHLPLLFGAILGVLGGARGIGWLLAHFPDLFVSFLAGLLVVSVWVVGRRAGRFSPWGIVMGAVGFGIAWALAQEPLSSPSPAPPSLGLFALAGAVGAGTAVVPGVSGGSLLVLLGLYDDVIAAVNGFDWPSLLVFAGGAVAGVFLLAAVMRGILRRDPAITYSFLAGLILGAGRALLPASFGVGEVLCFLFGAAVLFLSTRGSGAERP
jgi:putative membrane protein